MLEWTTKKSEIDDSVNFYREYGTHTKGIIECRYVRRTEDYFIVYLSSDIGCNKACRFCHLTQTNQTSSNYLSWDNVHKQIEKVFEHYKTQKPAKKVHFNFMARGEPLSNDKFEQSWEFINSSMESFARREDLDYQVNISTIMPLDYRENLMKQFNGKVTIYYSLYSMNHDFRRKWLPKAMPVGRALDILKDIQSYNNIGVKLHWAFIEGENDSVEDFEKIYSNLPWYGVSIEGINIIKYNPFSERQGKGISNNKLVELISAYEHYSKDNEHYNLSPIKLIPRVGFDVNASCGMFVNE
jgi:23S rRNA (adenine2503-C2)-methyltransferase